MFPKQKPPLICFDHPSILRQKKHVHVHTEDHFKRELVHHVVMCCVPLFSVMESSVCCNLQWSSIEGQRWRNVKSLSRLPSAGDAPSWPPAPTSGPPSSPPDPRCRSSIPFSSLNSVTNWVCQKTIYHRPTSHPPMPSVASSALSLRLSFPFCPRNRTFPLFLFVFFTS